VKIIEQCIKYIPIDEENGNKICQPLNSPVNTGVNLFIQFDSFLKSERTHNKSEITSEIIRELILRLQWLRRFLLSFSKVLQNDIYSTEDRRSLCSGIEKFLNNPDPKVSSFFKSSTEIIRRINKNLDIFSCDFHINLPA
jgi:hypothetical protein